MARRVVDGSPDNLPNPQAAAEHLWSDGTPLTAEDVVASVASVRCSGKPLAARAIDPLTIEIRFPSRSRPACGCSTAIRFFRVTSRWPNAVGLGPFVRRPAPWLKLQRASERAPRTLVTQPPLLAEGAGRIALPYLDELTLAAETPEAARLQRQRDPRRRLRGAEEAGAERQGAPVRARPRPRRRRDVVLPPLLRSRRGEGVRRKPWLTREFRLAISAAVDRREYCKQVYFGACDPMAGPVTPANAAWFNPDLPLGRGNPLVAREMLADLGLRDRTGDGMLEDAARRAVRFSLLIRRDVPHPPARRHS